MQTVPLAMVPEDGCESRTNAVVTLPVEAAEYDTVVLDCQRSPFVGMGPAFEVTLQESTDRVTWTSVAGQGARPGLQVVAEVRSVQTLSRRWLRVRVEWPGFVGALTSEVPGKIQVLGGWQELRVTLPATRTHPAVTFWCSGSLERRVT